MIFDNTPTEKIIEYLKAHPGKATGHIFISPNKSKEGDRSGDNEKTRT